MRRVALLTLALTSCAHVAVPASRPVAMEWPADASPLDAQGVRELLAGAELELGDERAKTAAAEQKLEHAKSNTILAGGLGFLFGALLTFFVALGVNR